MWLDPHFWQYAKCSREEVVAAQTRHGGFLAAAFARGRLRRAGEGGECGGKGLSVAWKSRIGNLPEWVEPSKDRHHLAIAGREGTFG